MLQIMSDNKNYSFSYIGSVFGDRKMLMLEMYASAFHNT